MTRGLLNAPKLAFIGCGTMGRVIIDGLFARLAELPEKPIPGDTLPRPAEVWATVIREESVQRLKTCYGSKVKVVSHVNNASVIKEADVIFLCCKPQKAREVLESPGVAAALASSPKLLISVCAGVTLKQLHGWVPSGTNVIRAMPNTPCQIREGMTILCWNPDTPSTYTDFATQVFTILGRCRALEEKHINAATGLAASGPAFICVILESLADGGVMMGLPRDVAYELAAQVLQGTARMALQTAIHPAALKDLVTTPAGCTIAGLLTMEDGKIRSTLARTVEVAASVAGNLGQDKDTNYKRT
ncbi:delta 1-pyrroline-5-carboxylate reductase [Dimargaris cristalligena]|uniref:Pyrroline-5-carboxylate reductase n=1 Tax=Dimargaris cristalligena TaxID=215637 RepID=A0A4P9ZQW8_9FUNG|nr:delta 1-pyrroline-5-carboxylate reductase [Dimargaris cristalligena]RKP35896.1 pyrroline-5-carboxylate reductase dimerization-domain-containing protein [Dimargaris cristalligena]|eukprot:RKP35896.1 pyrroline-5-carboxylate reductase dimerization-domain-containing protein [Dimargaris cristalligena]